jgi:hypothetical protein
MSAISKATRKEMKMTLLESHTTMLIKKLPIEHLISNMQTPIIIDPIDPRRISKSTNSLTKRSLVKAGLVFLGTVGAYYLAKTTGIFSYLGREAKNLNSKNISSNEIVEAKNPANALSVRTNLETARQINNPSVNRIAQTYKSKDKIVTFDKIKVEEFKNSFKEKEKKVLERKSFSRRSIAVQNPIPNQNAIVGKPFELTINVTNIFSSSSDIFLDVPDIPTWLTLSNLILKGSYDTPDRAHGVAVSKNYAYVTDLGNNYVSGLQIIDITDPANPTLKGSYDTPGFAYELAISGNYAYVADWYSLQIIDVSDPANPTFKSSYSIPDSAWGVTLSGNYAYVACRMSGLYIIDVSDPSNPTFKGLHNTPGSVYDVAISGNYAYVADFHSGLRIIDITDPANSTLKESYETSHLALTGITVSENYAYVTDAGSTPGLQIINITDPSNPIFKGSYNTPSFAHKIALSGNYAYVTCKSSLQIIDISDPSNPTFIGLYNMPDESHGVAAFGNYAYVAVYTSGLQIIDITDPEKLLNKLTLLGTPSSVGTYSVNIRVCNEAQELAIDSFDIIVKDYSDLIDIIIPLLTVTLTVICFFSASACCYGIVIFRHSRKNAKESDNDIQTYYDKFDKLYQHVYRQQKELEVIEYDEKPPKNLCCPISSELMKTPVIVMESEQLYDMESIENWFENHDTDPLTNKKMTDKQFKTSFVITRQIEEWVTKHKIKK